MKRLKEAIASVSEAVDIGERPTWPEASSLENFFVRAGAFVDNAPEKVKHFQNTGDTLVLNITKMRGKVNAHDIVGLLQEVGRHGPDEIHVDTVGGKTYLRLWWD